MKRARGRVVHRLPSAISAVVMTALALTLLPPIAAHAASVAIKDFSFDPGSVTISPGGKVDWSYAIGNGTATHTVTADDGSFDSGDLSPGGSFSHTYTKAGTFRYYCKIHGGPGGSGMSGVVVVKSSQPSPSPTPTKSKSPTPTPKKSPTPTHSASPSASASASASASPSKSPKPVRKSAKPTPSSSRTVAAGPVATKGTFPTAAAAVTLVFLIAVAFGLLMSRAKRKPPAG